MRRAAGRALTGPARGGGGLQRDLDQRRTAARRGLGPPVAGGLDHHPDQRLGAARPQQHPAAVAELGLDLGHRLPDAAAPASRRVGHRHVDQHLGDPGRPGPPSSSASGRPARTTRSARTSPVRMPVAGGGPAAEDDVAGLLAAEGEALGVQGGQHVAVPDRGLVDGDAPLGHGQAEARGWSSR